MARYRIVCTNQEPANLPTKHAHIVAVGTGITSDQYNRKWTLAEVLTAMKNGDTFYTQGKTTNKVAEVKPTKCAYCDQGHIKSAPDAVYDNNLDNLARCN